MKSRLSGLGLGLTALASFLSTASAATCSNPATAFDQETLKSGCCTSWITKRDVGAMPVPSLMERDDCPTATCCEKKKTLYSLTPKGSDIQCGSKFATSDQDGDTTGGIQYTFGPCSGASTKTCLIITVTPVKSGGDCYTLASGISVFIDDESVAPTTNAGGWNFGNAAQGTTPYCTKKTGSSGCQYWSCEFEQSLWESKVKNQGDDGLCGNTISVGVHFGIGSATCTQGNTGLKYGSNFFQYEKVKFTCSETENYCGTDDHVENHECPAECCPGQTSTENYCGTDDHVENHECPAECCPGQTRCDSPLCKNDPTPNCCPSTENYCGTDDHLENHKCPAECCSGQTRCDNPECKNDPTPNCCPDTENYCGNDGHTLNTQCPPTCCGGQCCDDKLCCDPPSDYSFCPQPQCQYGTGWGWMLPDVDDASHFVNKLKLCSANRWGEWFDIASLPYTGDLVVGRGANQVANGDVVGTVSLSTDTATTVKACFDLTKASAHITSVHAEVSCDPFDSTKYINSKKKSFNICAPGQWTYKFPPSGCLDWVHSQHDICITGIPKCSGHYYAIFHASMTKNSDGSCSTLSSCWTDT
ncbi:hypothetical protein MRS44_017887 [Fusarium solani]|uniref:uncharacterized protein n=1 Tax=Fusarium solani TaxID=169388 RepID=UPI0032C49B2F|nr:hypothetical protein MRS44_017887 [Fusarium solani]